MISENMRDAVVPLVLGILFAGILFGGGVAVVCVSERSVVPEPHSPPCGYGAAETLVREQDGHARIVCACGRPR